jgi:hypothetical protein
VGKCSQECGKVWESVVTSVPKKCSPVCLRGVCLSVSGVLSVSGGVGVFISLAGGVYQGQRCGFKSVISDCLCGWLMSLW